MAFGLRYTSPDDLIKLPLGTVSLKTSLTALNMSFSMSTTATSVILGQSRNNSGKKKGWWAGGDLNARSLGSEPRINLAGHY